jgi:anion-transporting  ArsA/GET3 family ATPase
MKSEAAVVDKARFEKAGIALRGELTAMMLDTKRTFDEIVVRYSSSKAKADKLLANKLYQYVSTSLAGTQEYMAMEKLVAVSSDPAYDLIILDTPPTANALDFLDAPERMVAALDSAAINWFVEAFESSGKFSLNLIARSAAAVLKGISKITGGGFLEAMAELVRELNDLFGGFKERAERVKKEIRSEKVSFVLVTSPAPPSIREVLFFAERLAEHDMPRGAFVVNRFHVAPPFPGTPRPDAVKASLRARKLALDDDAETRIAHAHDDAARLATLDALHVKKLEEAVDPGVPIVKVEAMARDVYDLVLLDAVAERIMTGGV